MDIFKIKSILIVHIIFAFCSTYCTKLLVDNPSFDDSGAWESGYLPCEKEQIIFPENYPAIMPLPAEISTKAIILPRTGALLFSQDSTIDIGTEITNNRSCESDGEAHLKPPTIRNWYDPKSWRTSNEKSKKPINLDLEGVPCSNDSVVLLRKGPLAIDMQNARFIRVGQLSLAGSILAKDYLKYLLSTDIGQILFQNSLGLSVEYYRNDVCGCHRDIVDIHEAVCRNLAETCERAHCLNPIKPLGSCCERCGATLTFAIDVCNNAIVNKVRKAISSVMTAVNSDELDFYVANYPSMQGNFLQVFIFDRNGYNEKSVAFAKYLNETVVWKKLFTSPQLLLHASGRPYNPNLSVGSIILMILCLLIVMVVGLIILSHYTPNNRYLNRIPQWIQDPRQLRDFLRRQTFVFARFDNSAPSGTADGRDIQDSVAIGYDARNNALTERAFDNPMFREIELAQNAEDKADEGAAAASKSTRQKQVEVQGEENREPFDNDAGCSDIQELTEIKLDSSSDDSGEEGETVQF